MLRREPARGGGQRGAARGRDRAAPELRGLLGLSDPAEEDEVHGRGRDGAEQPDRLLEKIYEDGNDALKEVNLFEETKSAHSQWEHVRGEEKRDE